MTPSRGSLSYSRCHPRTAEPKDQLPRGDRRHNKSTITEKDMEPSCVRERESKAQYLPCPRDANRTWCSRVDAHSVLAKPEVLPVIEREPVNKWRPMSRACEGARTTGKKADTNRKKRKRRPCT